MLFIIIPTHNSNHTISDAIKSVSAVRAKGVQVQILLCDDNSQDDTVNIAEKLDPKIVILRPSGTGVSSARNAGLNYVYSRKNLQYNDFVIFLDSDDQVISDALLGVENLSDRFDYIGFEFLTCSPETSHDTITQSQLPFVPSPFDPSDAMVWAVTKSPFNNMNFNSPWGRAFNAIFLQTHRIFFDESLTYKEDLDFNLQVLLQDPKSACIQQYGYKYIKHSESTVNNYIPSAFENEVIVRKRVAMLPISNNEKNKANLRGSLNLLYVYVFPKNSSGVVEKEAHRRFQEFLQILPTTEIHGFLTTSEALIYWLCRLNAFIVLKTIFKIKRG